MKSVNAPSAPVEVKHDEKARVLDGMVKRLRLFVGELQEEVKEKDYEIQRLQARLRKIHSSRDAQLAKDTVVIKKDAIIQSLKKRLRSEERHTRNLSRRLVRIRQFAELSMDGEVVPVKVMDTLTKEGLRRLTEDVGIQEGDIIYVTRLDGWGRSVVKDLAGIRIRAVVTSAAVFEESDPQMLPVFRELGVPLLSDKEAGVQVRGKRGLSGKETFEAALIRWQEMQAQHEREKKSEMIEHIFKEYKSERGKEVRRSG
jgi:predicted RNase H-like nuclease (RuvC/YqgF family)